MLIDVSKGKSLPKSILIFSPSNDFRVRATEVSYQIGGTNRSASPHLYFHSHRNLLNCHVQLENPVADTICILYGSNPAEDGKPVEVKI